MVQKQKITPDKAFEEHKQEIDSQYQELYKEMYSAVKKRIQSMEEKVREHHLKIGFDQYGNFTFGDSVAFSIYDPSTDRFYYTVDWNGITQYMANLLNDPSIMGQKAADLTTQLKSTFVDVHQFKDWPDQKSQRLYKQGKIAVIGMVYINSQFLEGKDTLLLLRNGENIHVYDPFTQMEGKGKNIHEAFAMLIQTEVETGLRKPGVYACGTPSGNWTADVFTGDVIDTGLKGIMLNGSLILLNYIPNPYTAYVKAGLMVGQAIEPGIKSIYLYKAKAPPQFYLPLAAKSALRATVISKSPDRVYFSIIGAGVDGFLDGVLHDNKGMSFWSSMAIKNLLGKSKKIKVPVAEGAPNTLALVSEQLDDKYTARLFYPGNILVTDDEGNVKLGGIAYVNKEGIRTVLLGFVDKNIDPKIKEKIYNFLDNHNDELPRAVNPSRVVIRIGKDYLEQDNISPEEIQIYKEYIDAVVPFSYKKIVLTFKTEPEGDMWGETLGWGILKDSIIVSVYNTDYNLQTLMHESVHAGQMPLLLGEPPAYVVSSYSPEQDSIVAGQLAYLANTTDPKELAEIQREAHQLYHRVGNRVHVGDSLRLNINHQEYFWENTKYKASIFYIAPLLTYIVGYAVGQQLSTLKSNGATIDPLLDFLRPNHE